MKKWSIHWFSFWASVLLCCSSASAGYQVMVFYNKYCGHCKSWMETTGQSYDADAPSRLGGTPPTLRKFDLSQRENYKLYKNLLSAGKLTQDIPAVPTFVVVDNDEVEINRTVGAMSKDEFYAFVSSSLQRSETS